MKRLSIGAWLLVLSVASAFAPSPSAGPAGFLAGGGGSKRRAQAVPENDASNCPYCKGDPELMARVGVVSHGGFRFGTRDTAGTDALLPNTPLFWIETQHFEIGSGLERYAIPRDEREPIKAELAELRRALPAVPLRVRNLDPWLRLHLYAQRMDRLWKRVQTILNVTDEDFPQAGESWSLDQPYRGEGPHLGMAGKFELFLLPDRERQSRWLQEEFGLRTERTQRWNIADAGTLTVAINANEERLRRDAALHGHVVFSMAINLVDGFRHYAYETPVWLNEGLAHYLERELDPRFNSFSYSEAALAEETRRDDWCSPVRRLVANQAAPSVARLAHLQTPAQMGLEHHYAAWSMTAFLVEHHGEGYACLVESLHGLRDGKGLPDGGHMTDKHRDAFERCLGMRYQEFDEAWAAWAKRQTHKKRR